MKKFTVVLLYPDYETDNYGETWCSTVEATDAVHAVEVAQSKCAADNGSCRSDDYLPVSVFAGDHPDLINQWVEARNAQLPA